uniref:hydroxyacid-oxoacid transhydrogenase n=1 Tax=Erythrolobus australicus TaxID=1077150 RepID=A0A7S1XH59_9RHOD|mmetsp:Transcript_2021/g.5378  ORF Transcript_2021/g.5378 Transcript_2021/m.5378 type:complete len:556 (+) Transcript_2021:112-1779(+)
MRCAVRLVIERALDCCGCPCHGTTHKARLLARGVRGSAGVGCARGGESDADDARGAEMAGYDDAKRRRERSGREYAFEVATSVLRFGRGVSREVGLDVQELGAKRVLLVTDRNIASLSKVHQPVLASLRKHVPQATLSVYDGVRVEPTESSVLHAVAHAIEFKPDVIIAQGGGSVLDTAKIANLYSSLEFSGALESRHCSVPAEGSTLPHFLDYVNAPIGRGLPIPRHVHLAPLIAMPTTAGTGSETTGTAIFEHDALSAKTGISSRLLRPTLAIVDPLSLETVPIGVGAAAGMDVLCHALESYTARPYYERAAPSAPNVRPAYQGANPVSDVWALQTLKMLRESFGSREKLGDPRHQEQLALAASYAGVGFGNAGVHVPHGLSYSVGTAASRGLSVYQADGYVSTCASDGNGNGNGNGDGKSGKVLVPHGVSVAVVAPAVFRVTAHADPLRHAEAFEALTGESLPSAQRADGAYVGARLAEAVLDIMRALQLPLSLGDVGITSREIPAMLDATLLQRRVLDLAPSSPSAPPADHSPSATERDLLSHILHDALTA